MKYMPALFVTAFLLAGTALGCSQASGSGQQEPARASDKLPRWERPSPVTKAESSHQFNRLTVPQSPSRTQRDHRAGPTPARPSQNQPPPEDHSQASPAAETRGTLNRPAMLAMVSANPAAAEKISNLAWVKDGVTEAERETLNFLTALESRFNNDEPGRITGMPFLKTWEPEDLQALATMWQIHITSPDRLKEILDHPTFSKTGISDRWTPVIAASYAALQHDSQRLASLLTPGDTNVETATIRTAYSDQIQLHIVRGYPRGRPQTMRFLKEAVAHNEHMNDEALPNGTVVILMGKTGSHAIGGINYNAATIISAHYDQDGAPAQPPESELRRIIVHEVAHHYWHGKELWLNEGMAELLAGADNEPGFAEEAAHCARNFTLARMPRYRTQNQCQYRLGAALLKAVRDHVGQERFYQAMKRVRVGRTASGITALMREIPEIKGHPHILRWYYGEPATGG